MRNLFLNLINLIRSIFTEEEEQQQQPKVIFTNKIPRSFWKYGHELEVRESGYTTNWNSNLCENKIRLVKLRKKKGGTYDTKVTCTDLNTYSISFEERW